MAFKELYNLLENAESMVKNLSEQINNPNRNYEL